VGAELDTQHQKSGSQPCQRNRAHGGGDHVGIIRVLRRFDNRRHSASTHIGSIFARHASRSDLAESASPCLRDPELDSSERV
jgi:hypothetical protein